MLQSRLILIVVSLATIFLTLSIFNKGRIHDRWQDLRENPSSIEQPELGEHKEGIPPPHPPWKFKPEIEEQEDLPMIVDNFPSAAHGLPPIPEWNRPPARHGQDPTPLLIGFTRSWGLLQQSVVSYITSGWPANDIYVIENTGVMDNNKAGRLNLQNPFFLNYTRLEQLGVNIIRTPTLLNFAQLQNFYINFAVERQLKGYFWSHMDVISLSDETHSGSVYSRALDTYHEYFSPNPPNSAKWAAIWFAYDRLVLVDTASYLDLGGWDTFIGYYLTDCDFHERIMMKSYTFHDAHVGFIYDIGHPLPDLSVLYRIGASKNDDSYRDLIATCDRMQIEKNDDKRGRNFWQARQEGGKGDPFYKDPKAFEAALLFNIEQGRRLYAEKWGHRGCDLRGSGLGLDMAWRVQRDWKP